MHSKRVHYLQHTQYAPQTVCDRYLGGVWKITTDRELVTCGLCLRLIAVMSQTCPDCKLLIRGPNDPEPEPWKVPDRHRVTTRIREPVEPKVHALLPEIPSVTVCGRESRLWRIATTPADVTCKFCIAGGIGKLFLNRSLEKRIGKLPK